jgi:hypothetical protein
MQVQAGGAPWAPGAEQSCGPTPQKQPTPCQPQRLAPWVRAAVATQALNPRLARHGGLEWKRRVQVE